MRIAAGILMIIVGFLSLSILGWIDMVTKIAGVDVLIGSTDWMVAPTLLSLVLTWGGGICAFRKRMYWWAVSGAICSIFIGFLTFVYGIIGYIFFPMGILALIFLIKSKGEF